MTREWTECLIAKKTRPYRYTKRPLYRHAELVSASHGVLYLEKTLNPVQGDGRERQGALSSKDPEPSSG